MEKEKIIIESQNRYKHILAKSLLIIFIIIVMLLIAYPILNSYYNTFWAKSKGVPEGSWIWNRYKSIESICYIIGALCFGIRTILLAIWFLLLIFYLYIANTKMIITDKLVYGKVAFGKKVCLPLDSISAIATTCFKGLVVSTSSGRIVFRGISNRDDMQEVLEDLLMQRQKPRNIALEEIKKYKELLDIGIISEEEFDAKRKELFGV